LSAFFFLVRLFNRSWWAQKSRRIESRRRSVGADEGGNVGGVEDGVGREVHGVAMALSICWPTRWGGWEVGWKYEE